MAFRQPRQMSSRDADRLNRDILAQNAVNADPAWGTTPRHRHQVQAVATFICRDCNHHLEFASNGQGLRCTNPECNRYRSLSAA